MEGYNIYCDESCHLEHDNEKVMVIGGIRCPRLARKRITKEIYDIKKIYNIPQYAEIKWNKVSKCNIEYFKAIIDYFFSCEDLCFRAVIVDKTKMNHERFNQTHDDFYYKMYFHCLSFLINTRDENYIYLDKKDTKGKRRIEKLRLCLSKKTHDFDQSKVKRIQCVTSNELVILQITDLIIGAIGYYNRNIENRSESKMELINYIKKRSGYSLKKNTYLSEQKFNLFFIQLQEDN